jgi:SAM-dependent methyltransferase
MSIFDPLTVYDAASINYLDVRERLAPFCLDEVAELMRVGPGDRVLDMACGPGGVALRAAGLLNRTGEVVGADVAELMLRLARGQAAAAGLDNVVFETADLNDLPYALGTFDAVSCCLGIFFATDVAATVGQLWNLLKPGGRLVLAVMGRNMFAPLSGVFADVVQTRVPNLVIEQPWAKTADLTLLRSMVAAAGVPDANFIHRDYITVLAEAGDWWRLILGTGFRNLVMRIDETTLTSIRAEIETWLTDNDIDRLTTGVHFVVAAKDA